MNRIWAILMILLSSLSGMGQSYSTSSKKAIKRFEEGVALYREMELAGAEEVLKKAISADDEFIEAYALLSQICYEGGRTRDAISYYSRILEIDPGGNPDGYRLLAGLYLRIGDYQAALELLDSFLAFPPEQVNYRESGLAMKESCIFAISAMDHPVPFDPENLGDSVNSELNEYWPCLSVDEQQLMFTVMLPLYPGREGSPMQEDFYISKKSGDHWTKRINAGAPLNSNDNEGAHSITADGRTLFFTACNRRDGKGKCDIYTSTWEKGRWSIPVNLGAPVNSGYSEKHPSISADGRVLYFTSDRPGGKGSYDIWKSHRSGNAWSIPQNLGDSVNTFGVEQSPFLHPDQRSLYFSSTGWPGMGQGDLFISRKSNSGDWSKARNLGYPINTYSDEIGLSVNARGFRAYFASDRGGLSNTDIFTFELPLELRPVLVSYLTGRVYDSKNMKGMNALIQLIDLETEEVVSETATHLDEGGYLLALPTDRDYALNVTADGYLFYSDHFAFRGEHSSREPFQKNIPMERIIAGSSVILNNIFFESDSHTLMPASMSELNRVLLFLEENSKIIIEIGGHTDSTGSKAYNLELSRKRADAVVDYLSEKGVSRERLKSTGYGDTRPLAENSSESGRAMNRRTELKILKIRQ